DAEMKFIDRVGTESLGVANCEQLRPAHGERIEARHACSALLSRIWVVALVPILEVIHGEEAQTSVCIDASRAFVIVNRIRKCRSREKAIPRIRLWDVLQ